MTDTNCTEALKSNVALQQEMPFRYVDRLEKLSFENRRAVAHLNINSDQKRWGCHDVMPSYLLIEAMAQTGGVLLRQITEGEPGGFLVGIKEAQLPLDIPLPINLEFSAHITNSTPPFFDLCIQVYRSKSMLAFAELQVRSNREFI